MMQENENKPIVKHSASVEAYLNELIEILLEQGYFSFRDSAKQYVSDMMAYIEKHISHLPKYPAPRYFSKYEPHMQYIAYKPNKRTTWYIFFLRENNVYLVCYIINNHFEGQYIR